MCARGFVLETLALVIMYGTFHIIKLFIIGFLDQQALSHAPKSQSLDGAFINIV